MKTRRKYSNYEGFEIVQIQGPECEEYECNKFFIVKENSAIMSRELYDSEQECHQAIDVQAYTLADMYDIDFGSNNEVLGDYK